jgi:hypothetical protein
MPNNLAKKWKREILVYRNVSDTFAKNGINITQKSRYDVTNMRCSSLGFSVIVENNLFQKS